MRHSIMVVLVTVICLFGTTPLLAGEYNEAPMLRTLVAAGELPSIEKRLPDEPLVVEPLEEIGQYGGTAHVFAVNLNTFNDLQHGMSAWGGMFLESTKDKGMEPNIAKGYKWSEDLKTLTIYLRKGLKWSDGAPFTANDIVFQFEDVWGNDELTPVVWTWNPGGKLAKAIKVSDYTLRLEFSEPYAVAEVNLQLYPGEQPFFYQPKHYLKKWHIKYNPKANELAKEENFDHWWQAFKYHAQIYTQQEDINLPQMLPWIMKKKTTDAMLFERNPYYWKVDTAGNQLPYIDKVMSTIVDMEVYQLKVVSGEADYAFHGTFLGNYSLYKENEEKGGYRVILYPNPDKLGSALALGFNFNEKDPVLRKVYHDIRFRQALSLATNRDEINELVYFGKGVPRNVAPHPSTSYYKKGWGEYYAQHDPKTANHLLDEMGLERGKDGFRLRSDGKTLELIIEYWEQTPAWTTVLELVKEYWEAVGVKTALKQMEYSLFHERTNSSDHGITAWERSRDSEIWIRMDPYIDFGYGGELSFFYDWAASGQPKPRDEQTERPGDTVTYQDVKEQLGRLTKLQAAPMGSKEYIELAQESFDYFCKQLWCIGTVAMVPQPHIFKNTLRNIPDPAKGIFPTSINKTRFAEQWFFKE